MPCVCRRHRRLGHCAPDLTDVAEVVSLVVPAASELRTTTGEVWSLSQAQIPSEPADSILQEPITGIDGPIAQLIAGYEYSCALRTDGAVFCWAEGVAAEFRSPSPGIQS